MEYLKSLETIIANAKKSLSRPYNIDTVNEKKLEIQRIQKNFEELLIEDKEISEKFNILKEESINLLELHLRKREDIDTNSSRQDSNRQVVATSQAITMANLDINELSVVTKLIPKFGGRSDDLHNFITNLETVALTISNEKRESFFNFVFKSRLEVRVQNRIKQISVPSSVDELIRVLKTTYKPLKNANTLLNEITRISQRDNNVMNFAIQIENLMAELNEIQISEEGENNRDSIIATNGKIAFNAFMNGLSDPQIISTIDASQVTTFSEALKIAEKVSSRVKQKQVFHQKIQYEQNNGVFSHQIKCKKCGGKHGFRCPAVGTKCHNCGKLNHFAKMCLTKSNANNRNNNNHNYNTISNNNNRHRNNNNNQVNAEHRRWNNNRHRNYRVAQIENQGNSQVPEATQMVPPMGIN